MLYFRLSNRYKFTCWRLQNRKVAVDRCLSRRIGCAVCFDWRLMMTVVSIVIDRWGCLCSVYLLQRRLFAESCSAGSSPLLDSDIYDLKTLRKDWMQKTIIYYSVIFQSLQTTCFAINNCQLRLSNFTMQPTMCRSRNAGIARTKPDRKLVYQNFNTRLFFA